VRDAVGACLEQAGGNRRGQSLTHGVWTSK
jgi:hypothetical protein